MHHIHYKVCEILLTDIGLGPGPIIYSIQHRLGYICNLTHLIFGYFEIGESALPLRINQHFPLKRGLVILILSLFLFGFHYPSEEELRYNPENAPALELGLLYITAVEVPFQVINLLLTLIKCLAHLRFDF